MEESKDATVSKLKESVYVKFMKILCGLVV